MATPHLRMDLRADGRLSIPYDIISGNHDDPVMMAEAFTAPPAQGGIYFAKIQGKAGPFLDTTTGVVSERQQEWLREQLQYLKQEALVFMHHPPLEAGVPLWIAATLRNQGEVQSISCPIPIMSISLPLLSCGKGHSQKNIVVHIAPPPAFQIGQDSEEFQVDHYRISTKGDQLGQWCDDECGALFEWG